MTLTEMSNEFDILYNNIMSNQAPGLDEYEKSLFLTKAQNELILEYFNPKGNKFQEGFDGSERRQIDFSSLIFTEEIEPEEQVGDSYKKRDRRSTIFKISGKNILLIINEFLYLKADEKKYKVYEANGTHYANGIDVISYPEDEKILAVVPVSYIEYSRLMMKPYKLPVKSQAWRLLNSRTNTYTPEATQDEPNPSSVNNVGPFAEILYNKDGYKFSYKENQSAGSDVLVDKEGEYEALYSITYIKKPSPIILINLSDAYSDVSIDNAVTASPCELDPIMHHDIVQRAVELAKAAYTGDLNTQIQVGSVSATDLGVIPSEGQRRSR